MVEYRIAFGGPILCVVTQGGQRPLVESFLPNVRMPSARELSADKWKVIAMRHIAALLLVGATLFSFVQAEDHVAQNEPPRNSFLADSPWPMSHRGPFNQASSPLAGPTKVTQAAPEFLKGDPVPITLAISGRYPDGRHAIWSATTKSIFKVDASDKSLGYAAKIPRQQTRQDAISGAYSVIDKDGVYYVPRGKQIEAFCDEKEGVLNSGIKQCRTFEVPEELLRGNDDLIVGLSMTFDGHLAFVTRRGLVGTVSRDFREYKTVKIDESEIEVSNSIAVDDENGIYVVTNHATHRIQWHSDSRQLEPLWSVRYQTTSKKFPGRLGSGSGTTPSLIGFGDQDKFVVIGDGQELMHMVLFWRDEIPMDWKGLPGRDRRIAAEVPIRFGDDRATRSTTEQSLTVRGYEIVAVSNLYGQLSPLMRRIARRQLGNDISSLTIYRSNQPRIAPYGVEKFAWNPQTRKLESRWTNREISCPNGIPTMSEATGLLYCIGQRNAVWSLEAIDWKTGESVFHRLVQGGSRNNSFYAATEIGLNGTILTGTFGGMLRFAVDEGVAAR